MMLLCGAAVLPRTALAHREKQTTTLVEWTGESLAITHTFHRHDAEIALAQAGMIDRPEIDSLRSRALVAIHVEETFGIEGVAIETLGAETVGNRIYVYQEAALPALPEALTIRAAMLRNLWRDQINNVDVKVEREIKSLRFAGDEGAKQVSLV